MNNWADSAFNVVGLASVIIVGAVIATLLGDWLFNSKGEFDVIGGFVNPQPVLEETVVVGGVINVGPVVKCNLTDEPIAQRGERHFRRVDDGTRTVVGTVRGSGEWLPGCWGDSEENPLRFFENQLPPEVTPGLWIAEGSNTVTSGDGREDTEVWFSEQFEVVARE